MLSHRRFTVIVWGLVIAASPSLLGRFTSSVTGSHFHPRNCVPQGSRFRPVHSQQLRTGRWLRGICLISTDLAHRSSYKTLPSRGPGVPSKGRRLDGVYKADAARDHPRAPGKLPGYGRQLRGCHVAIRSNVAVFLACPTLNIEWIT